MQNPPEMNTNSALRQDAGRSFRHNELEMNTLQRLILILVFFAIVSISYLGSQYIIVTHIGVSNLSVMIPGEERIPFLPVFLIIYVSFYALPVIVFMKLRERGRLYKSMMAFLIAVGVHLVFFFTMPISYVLRPELEWSSELFSQLFQILYLIDQPINTFPSMHVSFAFLSHYVVKRYFPKYARASLIVACAVACSTLFVKQHYVMDVVSGFAMAAMINHFYICRSFPKRTELP